MCSFLMNEIRTKTEENVFVILRFQDNCIRQTEIVFIDVSLFVGLRKKLLDRLSQNSV